MVSFANPATKSLTACCRFGNKAGMESLSPLKKFRDSQSPKLSKAGLAKLLGVSRPTAHRWETGARKIGPDSLTTVSEKTGIPKRVLRPDLAEKLEEVSQ